jgi:hypothetical protein
VVGDSNKFNPLWFVNASERGLNSYVLKVITEYLGQGFLCHDFVGLYFFCAPSSFLFTVNSSASTFSLSSDTHISLCSQTGRAMAQAVSRRPSHHGGPGSIPGQVHVRFVVDKVALEQVFLRVVGFPLSISFHWCSITCTTW